MPRIGGLSFILAFFIAVLFVLLTSDIPNMPNLFGFFLGAGIVSAVGFIDDTKNIKPWMKLLGLFHVKDATESRKKLQEGIDAINKKIIKINLYNHIFIGIYKYKIL